jgi:protein-tyrosine kinase
MSRLYRAVEKAEREGLTTWTSGVAEDAPPVAAEPARPASRVDPGAAAASPVRPDLPIEPFDTVSEDQGSTDWGAPTALSPLFVAANEPGSLAAEQYRLLRTRLEGGELGRRTRLMLITSARIGDGKTTTSANLALTMAQEFQHKVVLVEADLRRPTLASLFGVRAEPGLVDVLVGAVPLDEALVHVPEHHLFILPAGLAAARSAELLASSLMERVVEGLRSRFNRVIFDTPPMTLADTHVLTRLADGVLMVVRAGVTPRPAVERALAGVNRDKLIGVVLNEVEDTTGDYAYAGEYAYPRLPARVSQD